MKIFLSSYILFEMENVEVLISQNANPKSQMPVLEACGSASPRLGLVKKFNRQIQKFDLIDEAKKKKKKKKKKKTILRFYLYLYLWHIIQLGMGDIGIIPTKSLKTTIYSYLWELFPCLQIGEICIIFYVK